VEERQPLSCFVITPAGGEFEEIFAVGIQTGIEAAGFEWGRRNAASIGSAEWQLTHELLFENNVVIVDVSTQSPNIYYELGIAMSIGRDVIVLAQNSKRATLPVSGAQSVTYEYTPNGLVMLSQSLSKILTRLKRRGFSDSTLRVPESLKDRQTAMIVNLEQQNNRLRQELEERERELVRLRHAQPGADQLVSFRENVESILGNFLDDRLHTLERSLAESQLETESLRAQSASIVERLRVVGDLSDKVVVDPHWPGRNFEVEDDLCFVLMPFSEPWSDDVWELLQNIIRDECHMRPRRADMENGRIIMHDIWEGISKARYVIADLTARNPNVTYEVGLADTIGKPVILLSQSTTDIPFDFLGLRLVTYQNSIAGAHALTTKLRQKLLRLP